MPFLIIFLIILAGLSLGWGVVGSALLYTILFFVGVVAVIIALLIALAVLCGGD